MKSREQFKWHQARLCFKPALIQVLLLLLPCHKAFTAEAIEVPSPNGKVRMELRLGDAAQLNYRVSFEGKPVIEASSLAILVDEVELSKGVKLGQAKASEINERFPWRGVHSEAVNHCKVEVVPLTHSASKTDYTLEARAFDDGIAFRFIVPGGARERVPDEATRFTLPTGSTIWYHGLNGHYEAVHEKKPLANVQPGEWAAPPVTFKLPGGGYASITEAALVNYSGMALQAAGTNTFNLVLGHKHPPSHPFTLRYSNDIERLTKPASISGPIITPWRVIMIGRDLNALVNCDIVQALCPPPDPKLFPNGIKTDWLKPGRAVWKYLDGGENTLEGMKRFSRQAGELGFEYNILEGFWSRWDDEKIKELVDYSRQQGVGLWFWKHSRELRTPEARENFFKKLRALGVAGAKIDFFDHEHKEIIDLYQALLSESAKYQLMVNFHGANKPTGESRTWPNELAREAIRGMESSRLQNRARHDVTLPFTRFLAGHADYTPVHFGARRGDTTWVHQIASAAVFTAPLLTYAANPTSILTNPAVEMIKSIPSVWDETIVLPASEIGEVAAFARRHGQSWFLAVMNGPDARALDLRLNFLEAGRYAALLVRDQPPEPAAVQVETAVCTGKDSLKIELAPGGGFIARFSRREK